MPRVEEDIQHLILIVQRDMEIRERRKLLESVPTRIRAIDKELKRMDEDLEGTAKMLDKLEQEKRHIEDLIKGQKAELERKRVEQRQVKTNKEFQALMSEIQYLNGQIDKEEERILVILDEMETRGKEMRTIRERITSGKARLIAEREQLAIKQKDTEDALKKSEDEKLRILPHLSPEVRRLYDRILKVKGDSGVANIVGDICQGCYSRVPPQKAYEIRRNDEITMCEVCGRILVYYEQKA